MKRSPKQPRAQTVFLNVPFDSQYQRLLVALIAGVSTLGLIPRCVLEVPTTSDRLERLLALISECDFSIHDLSRVQLSAGPQKCPRFNMPFELGLTVAMAMSKNNAHHWIVLEEANYRIQQSLSDLNGYDPYVHRGTIKGVFAALLNAFERPGYTPTIPTMTEVYRALCTVTQELEDDGIGLFTRNGFAQLVLSSAEIVQNLLP